MPLRSNLSSLRIARRTKSCLAAYSIFALVAIAMPIGSASAATPTPSSTELPLTIDDGPVPNAVATSVDCPIASSCVASGSYTDTIGITHASTYALSGGTWTAAQQLAPAGPPDYTFSDLNSVSCISVGNCIAVGDYRISTVQTESFYAVESSGTWARGVELPLPSDAASDPAQTTFVSASCDLGGTTCQLLGEYTTTTIPTSVHSVVDTYVFGTGLTGSPQEIAQLSGRDGIELSSISCTSSTDCVAVGAQTASFSSQATYVIESGGSWGTPSVLQNPKDPTNPAELLSTISCIAAGSCVAAGNWVSDQGNVYGESYTESGGAWGSAVDIGEPSQLMNPYVDDISCVTTVSTCTIVGALSDSMGSLHAATAQMTNGHWGQLAPAGVPSGATSDHELLGVSCATGVQCTAVGYYNLSTTTGGTEGMAASWTVGAPPGAITGLHKIAVSATTAQLAWTAPSDHGTGIDHYEITAKQTGLSPVDEGPAAGTSSGIAKLSPGTTYKLSVVAVATDGQTSAPVSVTVTLPAIVPTAPKITRVVSLPLALRVSWSSPKSTGGAPITSYYASANCAGVAKRVHFAGTSHQGAITGLTAGKTCIVRVSASNRVGTSQPSAPNTGRPRA
jgi:Fibronectin type III domain